MSKRTSLNSILTVQASSSPEKLNFSDFIGFANWDQWDATSDSAVLMRKDDVTQNRIECSRNTSMEVELGIDLDFASCLSYTWHGVSSEEEKYNYVCVHELQGFE